MNYKKMSNCYGLDRDGWKPQADMKYKRIYAAASNVPEGIMVTGGFDGNTTLSATEIFDGVEWKNGPQLPVPMDRHCQVSSKSGVIVAGNASFNLPCLHFVMF